jgi:hypothetical protein
MGNPRALEVLMEPMILTAPIRLNCLDFGAQKAFNVSLKRIENLFDIRLTLEKINPAKTRVIVDKANIILVSPRGDTSRTPNICMH